MKLFLLELLCPLILPFIGGSHSHQLLLWFSNSDFLFLLFLLHFFIWIPLERKFSLCLIYLLFSHLCLSMWSHQIFQMSSNEWSKVLELYFWQKYLNSLRVFRGWGDSYSVSFSSYIKLLTLCLFYADCLWEMNV